MGCERGFINGAATQVHDDLSRGTQLATGDDGEVRAGGEEALNVGGVAGQCADSAGEVVDALMSEEHAFLQDDDVFGDLFEFGNHVRRNEEAALRALSFHALPRQGENLLV